MGVELILSQTSEKTLEFKETYTSEGQTLTLTHFETQDFEEWRNLIIKLVFLQMCCSPLGPKLLE